MKKHAKDYLEEANAVVPKISVEDAIARHGAGDTLFIDVRDGTQVAESGTVAGAARIPRGMIEFRADETHELHDKRLSRDKKIAVLCAAGGQAALTGKTLMDMGYTDVVNIGGFGDWKKAGGPVEDG